MLTGISDRESDKYRNEECTAQFFLFQNNDIDRCVCLEDSTQGQEIDTS